MCSSFFTQSFNITRLINDIRNIHVDEFQSHFFKLRLYTLWNIGQEFISIVIDFFNIHRGHDQT